MWAWQWPYRFVFASYSPEYWCRKLLISLSVAINQQEEDRKEHNTSTTLLVPGVFLYFIVGTTSINILDKKCESISFQHKIYGCTALSLLPTCTKTSSFWDRNPSLKLGITI